MSHVLRRKPARSFIGPVTFVLGVVLALIGGVSAIAGPADQGLPADKVSAAGATLDHMAPGQRVPILTERIRVSSPSDLVLGVTAECSILTALRTGEGTAATDTANAFGQVKVSVEVDGQRVPVAEGDSSGEVVFCNREYQRTTTDSEDDDDGVDTNEDFIKTRNANAFNWLALDTGSIYDDLANGQNILDIVVYAAFERRPNTNCTVANVPPTGTKACAEALVGRRTLVIEPTHTSNRETLSPTTTAGG